MKRNGQPLMWFSRLLFGHWIRKHFAVPHSFIILCASFFICWMWLLLLFYLFFFFCLHSTFSMDSSLWMNTSIRLRSTLPFWNMVHVFVDVCGCFWMCLHRWMSLKVHESKPDWVCWKKKRLTPKTFLARTPLSAPPSPTAKVKVHQLRPSIDDIE